VPIAPAHWVSLRIAAPEELVDAIANFLIEQGAPGVLTEEAAVDAPLPASALVSVRGALERWLESLSAVDSRASAVRVASAPVADVDWSALAREQHRPVEIGRRLLVAPPWDVPRAGDREVLVIEPGMAFGTGHHATTRTCLAAIEDAVAAGAVGSALDVGTGSGILALALARLGVARVVAIDTDPAVLAIARANLIRNGASRVALAGGSVTATRARFDLVVANLLADALVAEAPALAAAVAREGRLVLSGILAEQVAEVTSAYVGWRVHDIRSDEEWRTLVLERRA
jgi:ribosomal protein L11 methyltransferase